MSKNGNNEALFSCWKRLRIAYFPDRTDLDHYSVRWSERNQRSCLASCNPVKHRVTVATVLDHPSCHPFLEALIYHEMCHAVLGPPKSVNGRRVIHGPDFKALERRHPGIPALNQWIKAGGWHNAVKQHRRRKTLAQKTLVREEQPSLRSIRSFSILVRARQLVWDTFLLSPKG